MSDTYILSILPQSHVNTTLASIVTNSCAYNFFTDKDSAVATLLLISIP